MLMIWCERCGYGNFFATFSWYFFLLRFNQHSFPFCFVFSLSISSKHKRKREFKKKFQSTNQSSTMSLLITFNKRTSKDFHRKYIRDIVKNWRFSFIIQRMKAKNNKDWIFFHLFASSMRRPSFLFHSSA